MNDLSASDPVDSILSPATIWDVAAATVVGSAGGVDVGSTLTATGFETGGANAGYDGTLAGDAELLTSGTSLAVGTTATINFIVRVFVGSGFPTQENVVTADATELACEVSDKAKNLLTDEDGDVSADSVGGASNAQYESDTEDHDGGGIFDSFDYDPQGYFYCEEDGAIIPGGMIQVNNATIGALLHDGASTGIQMVSI